MTRFATTYLSLLLLSVMGSYSSNSNAQVTAPQAAAPEPQELGRLFFTPAQRAAFERNRQYGNSLNGQAENDFITVNGVVKRSGGSNTVWVNNKAIRQSGKGVANTDLDKRTPAKTTIDIDDKTRRALKVGETLNRSTQEKSDVVGNNTVTTPANRR